ncbi:MAG: hypothetical protein C0490_04275 [Marivirga sp.]|nr:hypothetical protein [Marivirga sp.]
MSTSGKIVVSVSIASSALLAAWLLTGTRKEKTREFVSKKAESFKTPAKSSKYAMEDQEIYYI